jgi:ribosomal protein S18 acetylase RimI-like enzyme
MIIRAAESSDGPQAARITEEIMNDAWEKHERGYYPRRAVDFDIASHSAENFERSLQRETGFAFVAEEDGVVCGVVEGQRIGESGLARLGWIGVRPGNQRRGIGSALLEHVIVHCRAMKCHKVTLYTLPVLLPAINLYLKSGFVPEAFLRREWWGVDFLKMSLWL